MTTLNCLSKLWPYELVAVTAFSLQINFIVSIEATSPDLANSNACSKAEGLYVMAARSFVSAFGRLTTRRSGHG
jgi:hypothetical protein